MARHKSKAVTFPKFSRLPPELRDKIWYEALSEVADADKSALFPYRGGAWQHHTLPGSHPLLNYWSDGSSDANYCLHMQDVEVNLPPATLGDDVNRVAQTWAHEQGINMRFCPNKQANVISRPFDRYTDILYLEPGQVDDLYMGLCRQPNDPEYDFYRQFVGFQRMDGMTLAVHQDSLSLEGDELARMFKEEYCPNELYVIVGKHPNLQDNGAAPGVHERWTINMKNHRRFLWHDTHDCFEFKYGKRLDKTKKCKKLLEDLDTLGKSMDIDSRLRVYVVTTIRE